MPLNPRSLLLSVATLSTTMLVARAVEATMTIRPSNETGVLTALATVEGLNGITAMVRST